MLCSTEAQSSSAPAPHQGGIRAVPRISLGCSVPSRMLQNTLLQLPISCDFLREGIIMLSHSVLLPCLSASYHAPWVYLKVVVVGTAGSVGSICTQQTQLLQAVSVYRGISFGAEILAVYLCCDGVREKLSTIDGTLPFFSFSDFRLSIF